MRVFSEIDPFLAILCTVSSLPFSNEIFRECIFVKPFLHGNWWSRGTDLDELFYIAVLQKQQKFLLEN